MKKENIQGYLENQAPEMVTENQYEEIAEEIYCEDCETPITSQENKDNEGLCDLCLWALKH